MRIPLGRKRTRYQKARAALQDMLPKRDHHHRRLSKSEKRAHELDHQVPEHEHGFAGLHWMTAGLFVAAGAEAALGKRRGDHRPDDAIRWAPTVAAPMAAAAQAAHAIWPSSKTRNITRLVNSVALAVGAAGLVSSIRAGLSEGEFEEESPTLHDRIPSFAPLAFGAVGLLGLLLDSEETEAARAPLPKSAREPVRRRDVKKIRIRI